MQIVPILIFLFILNNPSFSQEKSLFGIDVGYISSNLKSDLSNEYNNSNGISLGVLYQIPSNFFGSDLDYIKTGLYFELKQAYIQNHFLDNSGNLIRMDPLYNIFYYATFPASYMVYPTKDKLFFLDMGIYLSYLLGHDLSDAPYASRDPELNNYTFYPGQPMDFKNYDAGFTLGGGLEFSISSRTKFVIAYKYSAGMININNDADFSQNSVNQRAHIVSFCFKW